MLDSPGYLQFTGAALTAPPSHRYLSAIFKWLLRFGLLGFAWALVLGQWSDPVRLGLDLLRGSGRVLGSVPFFVALPIWAWLLLRPPGALQRAAAACPELSPRSLFVLALGLRLLWILLADVELTSDYAHYWKLSCRFAEDPATLTEDPGSWPPRGTQALLGSFLAIFGPRTFVAQAVLATIGALHVPAVIRLTRNLGGSARACALAGLSMALWPDHVLYSNLVASDLLFSGLAVGGAALLTSPGGLGYSFGAGLLLGLAQWVRSTSPLFWVAGALYLWRTPDLERRAPRGLAFVTGLLIGLTPVLGFNLQALNRPSIVPAYMGGWSLLVGTDLPSHGTDVSGSVPRLAARVAIDPERPGEPLAVRRDRVAFTMGVERLKAKPGAMLGAVLHRKVAIVWGVPAWLGPAFAGSRLESIGIYIWYLLGGLHRLSVLVVAYVLVRRAQRPRWDALSIYVVVGSLTAIAHSLLEAQSRYTLMLRPLYAICVGLWLANLSARSRSLRARADSIPAS